MIDQLKKEMSDSMSSALESLKYQLSKVRTGRAGVPLFLTVSKLIITAQ